MRESTIEQYLVKRVKALGGEVRKVQWIGRRGAPDRLVMLPSFTLKITKGDMTDEVSEYLTKVQARTVEANALCGGRTLWVELKAPGKKANPHQVREHERMRAMGQLVVVIDSIKRVDEVLA